MFGENFWTDILILLIAGATGGLIGGAIAFVLSRAYDARPTGADPKRNFRVVVDPERKAQIVSFPPKVIKFPRN